MGLPSKYLGEGETEVLRLRTHAKALVLPALGLLIVAALTGFALAYHPSSWPQWLGWVEAALLVALLLWWVVLPFVRWQTTTYAFTDRRVVTRTGLITRHGHDLPLNRIVNLEYRCGVIDRFFGCGTLALTTAAEDPVVLRDIPDIAGVHLLASELLAGSEPPRSDARASE